MENRQKSYGERYSQIKVKVKLSKRGLMYTIFGFLCISEIILGVLWALGY